MPRFLSESDYRHDTANRTGVLLTNLGTPDAPQPGPLRRYLAEFLWDARVVEVPRPLWWLILHGVILRTRPSKSAAAYRSVWTEQGSPLLVNSHNQATAVAEKLAQMGQPFNVVLGMRYGNPSITSALAQLREQHVRRILVLPLYPQYCAATTASTFDAVTRELHTWRWLPELRFINQYHDQQLYIHALANSVREHWRTHDQPDKLVMSFHGIPKRNLLEGDPYHCQCHKTARLLAQALELDEQQWVLTFQSRLGKAEWLKPYTLETVRKLAEQGDRTLDVICPGFSADCVETLEEVVMENGAAFTATGGKALRYIPALNDRDDHIHALTQLIQQHTHGWPVADADDREATVQRAKALGSPR